LKRARRVATLAVLSCLAAWSGSAAAAEHIVRFDDPALAARIDGAPLYTLSVDCLTRAARERTADAGRGAILRALISNRLLAGAARRDFKDEQLQGGSRVAFLPDVASDDKLAALLRAQFGPELEAALQALPGATLDGLVQERGEATPAQWEQVFGKPGSLRLEYALNPAQIALAKKVVLLRYRLEPQRDETITLYQVYRRQNVQGRVELYNGNMAFLRQQVQLTLAGRFETHWAAGRFGAAALADLRRSLDEQEQARALLALHGIGDDIDAESALLGRLATRVSGPEIAAYYRDHRDEFQRIERVKARHIRVADERAGDVVLAGAARGEDFGALARRYSIAADAASGGELGWIVHEGKLSWLAQLAFMQPEGEVSRPFRAPLGPNQAAPWEIVLVERRVQASQAADSEAVAYVARKAVAREKAAAQLAALRERLLREATIEINGKLLAMPAPTSAPVQS